MGKSIFGKMSDYINDKVGYHFSNQEEQVRVLLEEVLKDKRSLKYTLPTVYFVSNTELKTKILITNTTAHVLIGEQMLIIACNGQASFKMKQMIQDAAMKDVEMLEDELKVESNSLSEGIIKDIREKITNNDDRKQDSD